MPALRSAVEDRWRESAGKGADVEQMRSVDRDLVEKEAQLLGAALRRVIDNLADGGEALVVGHSPTNEAAVLGLTGQVVSPLGKGEGLAARLVMHRSPYLLRQVQDSKATATRC